MLAISQKKVVEFENNTERVDDTEHLLSSNSFCLLKQTINCFCKRTTAVGKLYTNKMNE